jgi:hypothetical protein
MELLCSNFMGSRNRIFTTKNKKITKGTLQGLDDTAQRLKIFTAKYSNIRRRCAMARQAANSEGKKQAGLIHWSGKPATSATTLIVNDLTRYIWRYKPATSLLR